MSNAAALIRKLGKYCNTLRDDALSYGVLPQAIDVFAFLQLADEQSRTPFIPWLKDESIEDRANLPDPDVLTREIVEDLETALAQSPRSRWT